MDGSMSNEELKRVIVAAMALDARHPDFVDHSDDPTWEGGWADPEAEAMFDWAFGELIRRSGGNLTLWLPDGSGVEVRATMKR